MCSEYIPIPQQSTFIKKINCHSFSHNYCKYIPWLTHCMLFPPCGYISIALYSFCWHYVHEADLLSQISFPTSACCMRNGGHTQKCRLQRSKHITSGGFQLRSEICDRYWVALDGLRDRRRVIMGWVSDRTTATSSGALSRHSILKAWANSLLFTLNRSIREALAKGRGEQAQKGIFILAPPID